MRRATIAVIAVDRKDRYSPIRRVSWSPLAIGLRKRQVLAVLTKNRLLSIWESDGIAESWQRTCFVNHLLKTYSKSSQQEQTKIRAFSWLQPPPLSEPQKQLFRYLIIVDGTAKVSLFRIRQSDGNRYGSWVCSLLHTHKLFDPCLPADALTGQRARHQPPISYFKAGKWQNPIAEDGTVRMLLIEIELQRCLNQTARTRLMLACEPLKNGEFFFHSRKQQVRDQQNSNDSLFQRTQSISTQSDADFAASLKFPDSANHQLWESAASADGSGLAACVTFQPSEMDQHTTSSQRNCKLVYIWQKTSAAQVKSTRESLLELLWWIKARADVDTVVMNQGVDIVRTTAGCITTASMSSPDLIAWADKAEELVAGFHQSGDLDVDGDADMDQDPIEESCKIGSTAISFSEDLLPGRCAMGHTFARCGISLVAIQKPAASKYCSQCGKQFLYTAELGPLSGLSLSAALFEEFDVCP
jgi:hypothetical protein